MRMRHFVLVPAAFLLASFQDGATFAPSLTHGPSVAAASVQPAFIKDEHLTPVTGGRVSHAIGNQMPSVRTPRVAGASVATPSVDLTNAFLTRPYLGLHLATSIFDHCNPDYSLDSKICDSDGNVAYASNGVDPSFSKGYAMTRGGRDYVYYDGHNGWDLPLYYENVRAAAGGTVQLAGTDSINPCYGQTIIINHPNGESTRYAHLAQIYVSVGQVVDRGTVIAQSGNTGCSSGAHLHFGVYITSSWTAIDPYGWNGPAGADPWPADIGDLWLTGNAVDPLPTAPLNATAVAANASAVVSWQAPAFDGGLPILTYVVAASPGGASATVSGTKLTATVTGLTNGATYTFTVLPQNAVGNGFWSTPSNGIVPTSVPWPPLNAAASPANFGAIVTWSAPSYDGGTPVTGYSITTSPGGGTASVGPSARSVTIPSLNPATSYAFTVIAVNVNGNSAPSNTTSGVAPYPVHNMFTLDAWGGVHGDGSSPNPTMSAYWPNQNVARSMAILPDGSGGYVLDKSGGLHQFGSAAPPGPVAYWPGADLARDVVLLPSSTSAHASGYTLDAWGGLHAFGGAPAPIGFGYWPNSNLAKRVVLLSDGTGGYTLDAWGGPHAFAVGNNPVPPGITNYGYWPNWDIARDIVLTPGSTAANVSGVTLDGFGGLHPFGTAGPARAGAYWNGWDIARAIRLSPSSTAAQPQGWVLDGWGGLHQFGGAPAIPTGGYWPNTNLGVQLVVQ
jgi:murein DD-endopeptidase MepM/ murein hydrolase activator NlpD